MQVQHGYQLFRDGGSWCAVDYTFTDLATSLAGFGETPEAAMADYSRHEGAVEGVSSDDFLYVCPRCTQLMGHPNESEGCEDPNCPEAAGT